MGIAQGIVTFVVVWWLIFFMVLPIGVQSQYETDDVDEGTDPGAPIRPQLLRKAGITTLAALLVWTCLYLVVTFKLVPLDMTS